MDKKKELVSDIGKKNFQLKNWIFSIEIYIFLNRETGGGFERAKLFRFWQKHSFEVINNICYNLSESITNSCPDAFLIIQEAIKLST